MATSSISARSTLKIVALDRKTGKVAWNKKVDDYQEGYTITAAPIVVKGKVITVNAGGEFGVVGKVRALDAKTGEIVWSGRRSRATWACSTASHRR